MSLYFEVLSAVTRYICGKESDFSGVDERLLDQVLREHRLVGRFLAKNEECPSNVASALLANLLRQQSSDQARFTADVNALVKLMNDHRLIGSQFVLLKGHGACLRHNRKQDCRETHDVDLIAAQIKEVSPRLSAMADRLFSSSSPHEILNAQVSGLNIDLHRYYPVWSTTPEAGSVVSEGIGRFHQGELVVGKLGIASILQERQAPVINGTARLYIPDPAVSVLIHCAHCYRNVISRSSISIRNAPPVRLIEFFEIADDLQSSAFNESHFVKLILETKAFASVAWTAQLMFTMLGDQSLLDILERNRLCSQGYDLDLYSIWGGFWSTTPRHERHFFERHLETDIVADLLAAETHAVDSDGTFIFELGGKKPAVGHLGFESLDKSLSMNGKIQIEDDIIAFDLSVWGCTDAPNRRVHLDVLGEAFEHNWNKLSRTTHWKTSLKHVQPEVQFSAADDAYFLQVKIKSAEIASARRLPILIGAGEFLRENTMKAGALVPLEIAK